MSSYRGYAIRNDGRIKRGAYLAVHTPAEAHQAATELCDDDIERVEVWADAKLIEEVECHEPEDGSDDSSPPASIS